MGGTILMKKNEKKIVVSRRNFLKKSAYHAPSLLILGTLASPEESLAVPASPGGGSKITGANTLNQTNARVRPTK